MRWKWYEISLSCVQCTMHAENGMQATRSDGRAAAGQLVLTPIAYLFFVVSLFIVFLLFILFSYRWALQPSPRGKRGVSQVPHTYFQIKFFSRAEPEMARRKDR